jgi:kinesin family protein 3/17
MADLPGALDATAKKTECVKVVVRVRPLSSKELNEGRQTIIVMDIKRGVAMMNKPGGNERDIKDFTYDAVFDQNFTQLKVFEETALEIVDSVMDGFNGTVFAYGQTGSGKTHTMTGPDTGSPEMQGLLPRCFNHIFTNVDSSSSTIQYLVRGSFLEIYNEEVRDLLSKNPKERCEVKEDKGSGVYVKGLSAIVCKSMGAMQEALSTGLSNRSTGATNMNAESSRSHSIFMITVEQCAKDTGADSHIRVGKLNMVDLAGSERQSKTGAEGERLKEATKINLSLSALGNVISALVDGKSSHIPYRDSKLTRLLQDSLGGNTKTVMVANIGPADYNYDETLSTLRYAYRAKSIKNKPRINEDPKDAMIREFQEEIMRLKAELATAGGDGDLGGLDGDVRGGARVEKQVEYVEKIVEKTVEREVVIEQGPTPEEVAAMEQKLRQQNDELKREADRKRYEVQAQLGIAETEKQRLLAEVDREEQVRRAEQEQRNSLENQLKSMEDKMIAGKTVMEKAIEQEEELKKKERELRKQKKVEDKLKAQEEQQRVDNMELETKCASQEEQVQKLTVKLQKLWDKYQKAQQEMADVQQFNQGEREDMLSMIRDLSQTLKLKKLIMESFVPLKDIAQTKERANWDAEEDEWIISPIRVDKEAMRIRPSSVLGLPRPTANFTRINRELGDPNPRFMYDSVLITDLDLPERTTDDYEVHPELGENIERALLVALSPDDDDGTHGQKEAGDRSSGAAGGEDRPTTGRRKRPQSGRPGSRPTTGRKPDGAAATQAAAFPQARGLVSRE